jgi:hypothetical protein
MVGRGGGRLNCLPNRKMPTIQVHHAPKVHGKTEPNGHKKEDFLHRDRHNRTAAGRKHNALLINCKIIQNFLIKESWRMCKARKMAETQQKEKIRAVFAVGMC